jgi:hypothetical protein
VKPVRLASPLGPTALHARPTSITQQRSGITHEVGPGRLGDPSSEAPGAIPASPQSTHRGQGYGRSVKSTTRLAGSNTRSQIDQTVDGSSSGLRSVVDQTFALMGQGPVRPAARAASWNTFARHETSNSRPFGGVGTRAEANSMSAAPLRAHTQRQAAHAFALACARRCLIWPAQDETTASRRCDTTPRCSVVRGRVHISPMPVENCLRRTRPHSASLDDPS